MLRNKRFCYRYLWYKIWWFRKISHWPKIQAKWSNINWYWTEEDNFFLKPFGIEITKISIIFFDRNLFWGQFGKLFEGDKNKLFFTPSFGAGIYDDGSGKKLGNDLQFRTALEVSYELKNKNRIGIAFSHISNANLGNKNPGVEILSLSYHVPF